MKIWVQPYGMPYPLPYSTLHALDDQARLWLREHFPADTYQYHGDGLAVPYESVETVENKFIDAGGHLI